VIVPRDYDADPSRFLFSDGWPHDDVHPYMATRFAAAGARRVLDAGGGTGKLARLLPGKSIRCVLVDLSPAMLGHAASFLRCHGMSEDAAAGAAAALDLPLTLTMRGCVVYATKG
jgi:SAM-dependent methyltransferase